MKWYICKNCNHIIKAEKSKTNFKRKCRKCRSTRLRHIHDITVRRAIAKYVRVGMPTTNRGRTKPKPQAPRREARIKPKAIPEDIPRDIPEIEIPENKKKCFGVQFLKRKGICTDCELFYDCQAKARFLGNIDIK
jgi:hypothetical protein